MVGTTKIKVIYVYLLSKLVFTFQRNTGEVLTYNILHL